MASAIGLTEFQMVGVVNVCRYQLGNLHHGCPSYHLSIPSKFHVANVEANERHGGNSKMTSLLKVGGRNCTQWCFIAFKSVVDNLFRERCILASLFKQSIVLTLSIVLGCNGGREKKESIGLLDGMPVVEVSSVFLVDSI